MFGSGHCVAAEISRFELTSVGAPGWSRCCRGPTAGLCDVRSLRQCHSRVMAVPTCVCSVLASVERPGVFCGWAGRSDGEDKSRSLGFSPGTNFSSSLKFPVFSGDGAEQECSGYVFVLDVRNDASTKVVLWCQADFPRWPIAVFWGWGDFPGLKPRLRCLSSA